jgi:hypothetical protein
MQSSITKSTLLLLLVLVLYTCTLCVVCNVYNLLRAHRKENILIIQTQHKSLRESQAPTSVPIHFDARQASEAEKPLKVITTVSCPLIFYFEC